MSRGKNCRFTIPKRFVGDRQSVSAEKWNQIKGKQLSLFYMEPEPPRTQMQQSDVDQATPETRQAAPAYQHNKHPKIGNHPGSIQTELFSTSQAAERKPQGPRYPHHGESAEELDRYQA